MHLRGWHMAQQGILTPPHHSLIGNSMRNLLNNVNRIPVDSTLTPLPPRFVPGISSSPAPCTMGIFLCSECWWVLYIYL